MQDDLLIGEAKQRHPDGDLEQPGWPTDAVLGAPDVCIVAN